MAEIMPPRGYRSITVKADLFEKLRGEYVKTKEKPTPSFSDWVERILWAALEERKK